jgi:DNA-binding MarR family transcriptional regulator
LTTLKVAEYTTRVFPSAANDGVLRALLREARGAYAQAISPRLSAAGFDDIPPNGPFALRAMAFAGGAAVNLKRMLGITEQGASELIDTLVLRGYLEFRDNPAGHRGMTIDITERGHAMLDEVNDGMSTARWADFPFRPGDIVISTPAKSGTT